MISDEDNQQSYEVYEYGLVWGSGFSHPSALAISAVTCSGRTRLSLKWKKLSDSSVVTEMFASHLRGSRSMLSGGSGVRRGADGRFT